MTTMLLLLALVSAPTIIAGFPTGNFPPNEIGARPSTLLSSFGKIVDGAGYSLHNTAFSLDLAMQANPPVGEERFGTVTLEPYTNGRDQKWGTSFYGTNQVALSNGLVGKNPVSIYYPEGSSRDRARLYSFELVSAPSTYRVLNLETNLCLVANQRSSDDAIISEFGSCSEGNYMWLLRRTG